ncbi:MAG: GntR family transcriptional regulator [Actinopolymorphaceae bacterium]
MTGQRRCRESGCPRPHYARGWCMTHYCRERREGRLPTIQRQEKWRDAAADLRRRIQTGDLPDGSKLPAEESLAATYGLGITAMRAALAELQAEGLITRYVGRQGTLVGSHPPQLFPVSAWRRYVNTVTDDHNGLIAEKLGMTRASVQRWARDGGPSATTVLRFARAYGVPEDEALAAAGKPRPADIDRPCYLYRAYDRDDRLLYVGVSYDVEQRHVQHCSDISQPWWRWTVARITTERHAGRLEAEQAERAAIATESPVWNISHAPEGWSTRHFALRKDRDRWARRLRRRTSGFLRPVPIVPQEGPVTVNVESGVRVMSGGLPTLGKGRL